MQNFYQIHDTPEDLYVKGEVCPEADPATT